MTTPATTIQVTASEDEIARCIREALVVVSGHAITAMSAAHSELDEHYALQLAELVTPEVRREAVHAIVASTLSAEQQEAITDATVLAVFMDLVKSGVIALAVAQ